MILKGNLDYAAYDQFVGESGIERDDALLVCNLLIRKGDLQRFDVRLQLLHLAASDDRSDVWVFVEYVGNGDCNTQCVLR